MNLDTSKTDLPLVSVVVITYKRLHTLRKTVESFRANCRYNNMELIVTDDGSPRSIREAIRQLPFDKFMFAEKNEGLGANTNKGLRTATGRYILQLQDDWECVGPSDFLNEGVLLMEQMPRIGLIQYCDVNHITSYRTITCARGRKVKVFENDRSQYPKNLHIYSDRPHLKRKSLHERLGFYKEHVPMTECELDFCNRFVSQSEIAAAHIDGYNCFEHIGDTDSFNPSVRRARLKARLDQFPITRPFIGLYETLRRRKNHIHGRLRRP
jgi:glycosyltransferase involved in cell wall biosynthesis